MAFTKCIFSYRLITSINANFRKIILPSLVTYSGIKLSLLNSSTNLTIANN